MCLIAGQQLVIGGLGLIPVLGVVMLYIIRGLVLFPVLGLVTLCVIGGLGLLPVQGVVMLCIVGGLGLVPILRGDAVYNRWSWPVSHSGR